MSDLEYITPFSSDKGTLLLTKIPLALAISLSLESYKTDSAINWVLFLCIMLWRDEDNQAILTLCHRITGDRVRRRAKYFNAIGIVG